MAIVAIVVEVIVVEVTVVEVTVVEVAALLCEQSYSNKIYPCTIIFFCHANDVRQDRSSLPLLTPLCNFRWVLGSDVHGQLDRTTTSVLRPS